MFLTLVLLCILQDTVYVVHFLVLHLFTPERPVSEENVKNKPKKLAKPLKAAAQIGGTL